jgi:Rrf2 family transcriptional regulator, iron-sulfur cluster assembly transcription factor
MILSKSCIYGIQAAIHVAAQEEEGYIPINRIAERLDISFHFLTKVLQQVTQAGILKSYRGPRGGVELAKNASEVTLFDLVSAIDGTEVFTECMLGLPGCGSAEPCPAHDHWVEVRQRFTKIAQKLTLKDLAARANDLNVRLAGVPELDLKQKRPTKR